MWLEIFTALSFAVGIGGIVMAIIQHRARVRLKGVHNSQLLAALNRTNMMVGLKDNIRKMIQKVQDAETIGWVWSKHQGICDLYVMIVSHYLSVEKTFTYGDLKTLVQNRVITSKWEERIWRNLIGQRPENRNAHVPDNYIE